MNKLIKVMAVGAWCLTAGAATSTQKTTTDENGVTWNYTLRDGVAVLGWETSSTPATTAGGDLTIPSALDGYPVKVIGKYAFYKGSARKVVIPSSVEEIGEYVFSEMSLSEVHIPASVRKIGRCAFDFSTSCDVDVYIESLAAWCGVELARGLSYDVRYQLDGRMPVEYDTNPVECGRRVFFGGEQYPFGGNLVIPEGVTKIAEGVFPDSHRAGGTSTEYYEITSLTLPSSVKEIGTYAFENLRSLREVTLPSGLEKLGRSAFGSTSLSTVNIPDDMPFVEDLVAGLTHGTSPSSLVINISDANPNYLHSGNGLYSSDGKAFVMVRFATQPGRTYSPYNSKFVEFEVSNSVTRISAGAFSMRECNYLKRLVIPDGVTEIPVGAFVGCRAVTNIVLGARTESIGAGAFYNCSVLSVLEIPDTVREIGPYAFYYCRALKSVNLPEGMTNIGDYMAYRCEALENLIVPNTATNIGRSAISSCNNLTNLVIGSGIAGLGRYQYAYVDQMGRTRTAYATGSIYPIMDCGNMNVTFLSPGTIVGSSVFTRCTIRQLTLPAGIRIDSGAFSSCTVSDLRLCLADGTTAFDANYLANAPVLKTLTTVLEIPSSCTTVDAAAINQLVNLTKVVFRGESLTAIGLSKIGDLRDSGLDIAYIPEGGTEAEGAEFLEKFVLNEFQVTIVSSAVRESDAAVLDVRYVVVGMMNTFTVRSLAFQDGVRSFANAIRPTSFVDGTAANAFGPVAANRQQTVSWRISDDWDVNLGYVAFEVMTVETAELPLKLVKIPATAGHAAMRFSCNALTSAKVLDALFWHYADPNCGLTLTDGRLYDGGTLLADGTEPTAAGTAYVFKKMGYRLLTGEELEYANSISRLGLVPEGARQYAVESLEK